MTQLQQLLRDANYDAALILIRSANVNALIAAGTNATDRFRASCMIADVFDYGGFYNDAKMVIEEPGKNARQRLSTLEPQYISDPLYTKQEAWALMMWGMSLYRHAAEGYTEALKCFELARHALLLLQEAGGNCVGSLARAWYCIGLVHRQRRDYREARLAFRNSVELAGLGVAARIKAKHSTASYDYNLARCYGLGIGWIAYDESLLSDAKSALVLANRLLAEKPVKFIKAYLDVISACVTMSGSTH